MGARCAEGDRGRAEGEAHRGDLLEAMKLGGLAVQCRTEAQLLEQLLPALRALANASACALVEAVNGPRGRRFEGAKALGLPQRALDRWTRQYQSIDPLLDVLISRRLPRGRTVVTIGDMPRPSAFARSKFYREFLRPLSLRHAMLVALTDEAGTPSAAVVFYRAPSADPFSQADAVRVDLVAPYVAAAYRRCRLEQEMAQRRRLVGRLLAESGRPGVAVLKPDLTPLYVSPVMKAILHPETSAATGRNPGLRSGAEILWHCSRMLDQVGIDADGAVSALRVDTPLGKCMVTIRFVTRPSGEKRIAITTNGPLGAVEAGEDSAAVRITKREREVVQLVARGLKNFEIADRLQIKRRTVENHLHTIYSRTGISNRTKLVYQYRCGAL